MILVDKERLSDYSDLAWSAVLQSEELNAAVKIPERLNRVATGQDPFETIFEILRMPRKLVVEAVVFEEKHGSLVRRMKMHLPLFPVPEPWSSARKQSLRAAVYEMVGRACKQALSIGVIAEEQARISKSAVVSELLCEIEQSWESGQRHHYESLQKRNSDTSAEVPAAPVGEKSETSKRRRRTGKTTNERLLDLMSTPEGRKKILAAGSIDRIAKVIDRSHAAVGGSPVWKKKIKPLLQGSRAVAKAVRLEWDERRQDRRKTD